MATSIAYAATPVLLKRSFAALIDFVAIAGAAFRCAAAAESGYRPEQLDLLALGMGALTREPHHSGR